MKVARRPSIASLIVGPFAHELTTMRPVILSGVLHVHIASIVSQMVELPPSCQFARQLDKPPHLQARIRNHNLVWGLKREATGECRPLSKIKNPICYIVFPTSPSVQIQSLYGR
jgi:hypothetical protein